MNLNPAGIMRPAVQTSPDTELTPSPVSDGGTPNKTLQTTNLLETINETIALDLKEQCLRGFENDLQSREDWERDAREWIKLSNQIREHKSYPWSNASNVKYPLLSTAAMQFAARAYPSLVPSNGNVVTANVIGNDTDGSKQEKAIRVSKYMSYQFLHDMDGWEEDMDKLLITLPIVGIVFKKTWYDKLTDKIASRVILPFNLVVNYWTRNLQECERISEIIEISPRRFKEKQNAGIYSKDVDLGEPSVPVTQYDSNIPSVQDETTPYILVEQHTFYDLDDDGYAEPYIVTFEKNTGTLVRVAARYRQEDVKLDEDGKIEWIKPIQMYTKFGFVPNPDGSFYDIGFGILLGPLNESVNTLINQLIDSGHIHNLQSGFMGKALKIKMGESPFRPGEWKTVNAVGDDLRKQIMPLPTKEPSDVLFKLMGTLVTSGKELASVAEIFTGKMPGQNTPATTTMATVEQGMKVFTAVYKRIFRALSEEYDKVFQLNHDYLDPNKYVAVLDMAVNPDDFNEDHCSICPGADPSAMSQTEKLMKAQGLMELLQAFPGALNPLEVLTRILDAQEQPNVQKLLSQQVQQSGQMPPPPPDPKLLAIQAKMQADQQNAALHTQAQQQQMELDARDAQQKMMMGAEQHQQDMQFKQQEHALTAVHKLQAGNIAIAAAHAQAQQKIQQEGQAHQQKMVHAKEQQKLVQSQRAKSKNGNSTQ
jgi:chaperonin GroES